VRQGTSFEKLCAHSCSVGPKTELRIQLSRQRASLEAQCGRLYELSRNIRIGDRRGVTERDSGDQQGNARHRD
jgi:hypothetical protein